MQGYLAYWDELRRTNPDLFIDSCASGGRRNDLETMRRRGYDCGNRAMPAAPREKAPAVRRETPFSASEVKWERIES